MTYDTHSWDLAEYFLADHKSDEDYQVVVDLLAQEIQRAVEEFLSDRYPNE